MNELEAGKAELYFEVMTCSEPCGFGDDRQVIPRKRKGKKEEVGTFPLGLELQLQGAGGVQVQLESCRSESTI